MTGRGDGQKIVQIEGQISLCNAHIAHAADKQAGPPQDSGEQKIY